jgi:hypothetical protein
MKRRSTVSSVLIILFVVVLYLWFSSHTTPVSPPRPSTTPTISQTAPKWGVQTKTAGCLAHGGLPDSACTPGAIFPQATQEKICVPGYARSVRDVPQSLKDKVYEEYTIRSQATGQYEVDHLVSLQLGGSNDSANLWPEAASPKPGFHEKDSVENYLHAQVCSGAISLQEAQIEIATNWLGVYNRISTNHPSSTGTAEP